MRLDVLGDVAWIKSPAIYINSVTSVVLFVLFNDIKRGSLFDIKVSKSNSHIYYINVYFIST